MTFDISDENFRKLFNDQQLYLPIKWDGQDFSKALKELYAHYIDKLSATDLFWCEKIKENIHNIKRICNLIDRSVSHYLNGFPSKSYRTFCRSMNVLWNKPLEIFQKTSVELLDSSYNDKLNLFRASCVNDKGLYTRERIFHTPYNLRSKVSTNRYSIAGFPSLYLGTSLKLCCEEINFNPSKNSAIASKFKLERDYLTSHINIRVVELAIKPQDFLDIYIYDNNQIHGRFVDWYTLSDPGVREAYLLWYPLIAACSFIRANKNDPFAAEYIIPQLLMQWVRQKMCSYKIDDGELMGIRYFSCASEKASDMGFNYVFPSSGRQEDEKYCSKLTKAFKLTKPCYLTDFKHITDCERYLIEDDDYGNVSN